MSNKMLIDAAHPEETRVVVLRGNRVEEFDFEAADRQQLRGNIYLAKVTRVEPSLQAAFVEYGGNRHGFLAFSEIHPDYYQIPVADRQALLEEHARDVAEEAAKEEREDAEAAAADSASDAGSGDAADDTEQRSSEPQSLGADAAREAFVAEELQAEGREAGETADGTFEADGPHGENRPKSAPMESGETADSVESVGAEDAMEEVPERRKPRPRQYKIQEVIKRRQVLLVQVVKEERGNKGAALTTYLSLAGRYSVLMPNTARGGGISRKITNAVDRKRLKSVADELEVPQGMGVILRTAGASRTKAEIKRDFEYLLRLWENVRELTLRSTAPKLVYEEGSLIKRSIRDLYSREIEQILVAGDDAYREAKEFMRMLMPSHARYVQQYREDTPIFSRNSVETQLDAMFSPQVTLRSGGYIVINQTEALVAIDVNSGRSTREHSIEDTAYNTNLEAAEEIARQLRLRDLAGLIVIDFIDMEEKRNNRSVERKLKDALKVDRARLQVGRISHFGLLEMSRQRIRTGVLESSTVPCPHCRGTGQVRSISSLSLQILRAVEDHLLRQSGHHLIVRTRPDVAVYVLNQKRRHLAHLEARFSLSITVLAEAPGDGAGYQIERGESVGERPIIAPPIAMPAAPALEEEPEFEEDAPDDASPEIDGEPTEAGEGGEGQARRRSRRRRRGGSGRDGRDGRPHEARFHEPRPQDARRQEGAEEGSEPESEDEAAPGEGRPLEADAEAGRNGVDAEGRRRRRGRRGGRRRGRGREGGEHREMNGDQEAVRQAASDDADDTSPHREEPAYGGEPDTAYAAEDPSSAEHEPAFENRGIPEVDLGRNGQAEEVAALQESVKGEEDGEEHSRTGAFVEARATLGEPAEEDGRPRRSGWWSRRSFF